MGDNEDICQLGKKFDFSILRRGIYFLTVAQIWASITKKYSKVRQLFPKWGVEGAGKLMAVTFLTLTLSSYHYFNYSQQGEEEASQGDKAGLN